MKPGGSAANTALILSNCNADVKLFSTIGKDSFAELLLSLLSDRSFHPHCVKALPGHTTGITVSLTYPDDRMYITQPGTITSAKIEDFQQGFFVENSHIHLTSYFLQSGIKSSIGKLLQKAKEMNMTTSLDPGNDPSRIWDIEELEPYYSYLDYFLPNSNEIMGITNTETVEHALASFSSRVPHVVVKCGANGALSRFRNEVRLHSAVPVTSVDTTCAGDCFNAGFLLQVSRGKGFPEAIDLGIRFGALAAATIGLPHKNIIEKEIQQ